MQVADALQHEGGQEADHPEVPEAVRQVEADVAVRNRVGDRVENLVLLVDVLAEGNEARGDGKADGLAHEQRDSVEHRLRDPGVDLRIEQFEPRGLRFGSPREVLDEHAPLTAARAENDGCVRLQVPGQRRAEERRLARSFLIGEPIPRPLVPGLRIPSSAAQKRDQGVFHDGLAPGSSFRSATNSPNPKWLP